MARIGFTRRMLLATMAGAPLIGRANAQSAWPDRTVRVIVPYPPAGALTPPRGSSMPP